MYYQAINKEVKFYKKAHNNWGNNVNSEAKKITNDLKIDVRIHKFHI